MRVLAADTTTDRESVALVEAGALVGELRLRVTEGHSRRLVSAVAFLMESVGLTVAEVEGYAVTTGPGSFTGLRIGLSTVQGLALASGRPCIGISALDVLATRIAGSADRLVAVMDASRDQVFAQVYDREVQPVGPAILEAPELLIRELTGAPAFIGDGALRYRQRILETLPGALFPPCSLFLAGTLAQMAEKRFEAGEGLDPGDLRPFYLREADIRRATR